MYHVRISHTRNQAHMPSHFYLAWYICKYAHTFTSACRQVSTPHADGAQPLPNGVDSCTERGRPADRRTGERQTANCCRCGRREGERVEIGGRIGTDMAHSVMARCQRDAARRLCCCQGGRGAMSNRQMPPAACARVQQIMPTPREVGRRDRAFGSGQSPTPRLAFWPSGQSGDKQTLLTSSCHSGRSHDKLPDASATQLVPSCLSRPPAPLQAHRQTRGRAHDCAPVTSSVHKHE
ncbi:unnamed protein product [Protopolystoma xenopodis]|uniref:Uncharacterized protein n=1 Tax=Protopolystoma xenopodis TaxID=117903 RepID=A0A448X8H3_9PLAT|nr:unnamed protein product [Protopolystoma xenopodis]